MLRFFFSTGKWISVIYLGRLGRENRNGSRVFTYAILLCFLLHDITMDGLNFVLEGS